MTRIKKLARPIAKEFHKDKCGFDHTPADDFVKSQWQNRSKSIPYLLYRWIIGLFFIGVVIESLIASGPNGYYLIYLTNWGILMCMLTNLCGALLVTIYHFHPEYEDKLMNLDALTSPFKIYWISHIITLILSIVITIVFWSILYRADVPLTPTSILTHAFNSVVMFLDLLIVAYPIRILHIFLPVGFGIIFAVFSVIYHAAGGINAKGEPYIYNVLDWRDPGKATVTVIGVLLLACFVHMFIFMVYKVRVFVFRRLNNSPMVFHPTTANNDTRDIPAMTGVVHSPSGISMVLGNYTGYDNQGFSTVSERVERQE